MNKEFILSENISVFLRKTFLATTFFVISLSMHAQVPGDYRSDENGNWTTLGTWQRFNGGTWVTPNATQGYPGQNAVPGTVTIADQDVVLDVSPVNAIGNLTIGNGFGTVGSLTVSGNRNLVVNGDLFIASWGSTFTFSGDGNLTVNGDTDVESLGFFIDDDGTGVTTFAGLVTVAPVGGVFTTSVTDAANLVFRGGIANNAGLVDAGGATFNTNNQTLSGTPLAFNFANAVVVSGIAITNNSEVSIENAAAGALSGSGTWSQGSGTLNYAGATNTVATFNASNAGNTVNYNSTTSSQAVRLPSSTYYNLTFNNTSGTSPQLSLTSDILVTNALTLTSGIVNLAGRTLTLGSNGVASDLNRTGGTATNWMYGGSFTRFWLTGTAISSTAGNLYGLFPLGASNPSSYRPVAINSTASPTGGGSFTVTHTDAMGVVDLSPTFNDGGTAIVRKHSAQFITAIAGVTGGTYDVSVTMTGLVAGTLTDIRLAVSNGATTVTTVGTHVAATGTAQNPTAGRTGISVVSQLNGDFRITTANATATPLPVQLIDFAGWQGEDGIIFNWSTASELNNDFFSIERLNHRDGFDKIVEKKGNGTTHELSTYTASDMAPKQGKNYYRLKQTDFDGKFSYSDVIRVDFTGRGSEMEMYPNPVQRGDVTIIVRQAGVKTHIPIVFVDIYGRKVLDVSVPSDEAGVIKTTLSTTSLPAGVYIVLVGAEGKHSSKVIIR